VDRRLPAVAPFYPVKKSPAGKRKSEERFLVLESDETVLSSILSGLLQVAPSAVVDVARDVNEADRIAADEPVALFVFDLDAASEPNVVRDLRARHPEAQAIVLASADASSEGMEDTHLLEKPFVDSDFLDLAQTLLQTAVGRQRVLVIDDSLMMLKFVQEILADANYEVVTAGTAQEGLQATRAQKPDLILLDYLLPDLRGDELSKRLSADKLTADVPVVFMSGFGVDLENAQDRSENVLGILNKPFTTDSLLKAVEENLSKVPDEEIAEPAVQSEFTSEVGPEHAEAPAVESSPLWNAPEPAFLQTDEPNRFGNSEFAPQSQPALFESGLGENVYFSGETAFFSFSRALRVIGQEKLTGNLRSAGPRDNVDLYVREGQVVLATTRDPEAYCAEAPVTLVNIDSERVREARETQLQTGCPLFITLAREDLILRDPALQLVQHYGQKLFAQQWSAPRVHFAFEQTTGLPDFTSEIPAEDDIEHWMLSTLRFVQAQEIAERANYDSESIPAYTRDGFERVQKLRLTVAEAQFASQFNGTRSIAQIARNLRLDLRFARLTLFRFIELDIVECWPPAASEKAERGGLFKRLLGRSSE